MTPPVNQDGHLTGPTPENIRSEHHGRTTDYGKIALICIFYSILAALLCLTVMFYLMIFVSPILYFLSIGFAVAGIVSGNGKNKAVMALSMVVISSFLLFCLAATT